MNIEIPIRRAQLYGFLTDVFLYPSENWLGDLPYVQQISRQLAIDFPLTAERDLSLEQLQAAYRNTFGATGSLCYETEYGLPHEYRMSQELADIAGFYNAFGFTPGGVVRERPDHIAVELEFMHVLSLKEAYAAQRDIQEHIEVCQQAQRKFLSEHLGKWIHLFARALEQQGSWPYPPLAAGAHLLVQEHSRHLGIQLAPLDIPDLQPTPFDPNFSCAACECAPPPGIDMEAIE